MMTARIEEDKASFDIAYVEWVTESFEALDRGLK